MAGNKGGKPTYAGRITNAGPQSVTAPIAMPKAKTGTVKTGSDLRTGK